MICTYMYVCVCICVCNKKTFHRERKDKRSSKINEIIREEKRKKMTNVRHYVQRLSYLFYILKKKEKEMNET